MDLNKNHIKLLFEERKNFENFDSFRSQHPAFGPLEKKNMISDGLSAPLHPGAIKYYKEAGLM